jgi:hypothetical protein
MKDFYQILTDITGDGTYYKADNVQAIVASVLTDRITTGISDKIFSGDEYAIKNFSGK